MLYQHPPTTLKEPQIPPNRDRKALNGGTLGGLGIYTHCTATWRLWVWWLTSAWCLGELGLSKEAFSLQAI